MRLTLCLAFAAVVLLVPLPRAEACSPIPCAEPAHTAPPAGEVIPANAPAVMVIPRDLFGRTFRDAGISLHDADGGELAFTVELEDRGFLVRPSSPFEEGATYHLRFGEVCDFSGPVLPTDGGPPFEVPIAVGPEAPLPGSIGELKLLETKPVDFGMFSSCGGPDGINMVARFGITPSPEIAPWLPVTRFVLKVDGAVWGTLSSGLLSPDGRMGPDPTQFLGSRLSQVHARCPFQPDGGSSFSSDPGVRVGRHTARLEAFIAGSDASISASSVEFSLVCDGGFDFGDGPGPLDPRGNIDPAGCGCGASGAGGAASLMILALLGARRRWWRQRLTRRDPRARPTAHPESTCV